MSHLRLIFESNGRERPFLLRGTRWTIGRDPRSDIVVPDPLVSRRHAVLWFEGSQLMVRDAGAKNPVEVNGQVAAEALEIDVGSRLKFGGTWATLRGPTGSQARFEASEGDESSQVWVLSQEEEREANGRLQTLSMVADALQPVRSVGDAAWLIVALAQKLLDAEQVVVGRIGSQDRIEILACNQSLEEQLAGGAPAGAAASELARGFTQEAERALAETREAVRGTEGASLLDRSPNLPSGLHRARPLAVPPTRIPRRLLSQLRSTHRAASLCREAAPKDGAPAYELLMAAPWTRGDRVDGFVHVQRPVQGDEVSPFTDANSSESCDSFCAALAKSEKSRDDLQTLQLLTRLLDSRIDAIETIERLQSEKLEIQSLHRRVPTFLSQSPETEELRRKLEWLAPQADPLVIVGEPGTGKSFLALHLHSGAEETSKIHQQPRPFVMLRLSHENVQRAEDQLFGLEEANGGSSKITRAHGGTLCIAGAELLSESAQVRLVDEIQNGRVRVDGASRPVQTRLILTSSLPYEKLAARMHAGLREHFPHAPVETVPLRRRLDDIPLLASFFLEEYAHRTSTAPARVSPRAMDRLRAYDWPRNVKELQQVIETAAVLARGHVIYPKQLPPQFTQNKPAAEAVPTEIPTLKQVEAEHIRRVLELVGGNKSLACKALGIAYSTLHEKLKLM